MTKVYPDAVGPTYCIPTQSRSTPALTEEWLLTNGTGAFAMGTAAGCNTRRYHGLLIAATDPPVGRIVTVSNMLERVRIDGQTHEIATCEFAGETPEVFHPGGWHYLQQFEKNTSATWTFEVDSLRITRTLRLIYKRQLATLEYQVEPIAGQPAADRVIFEIAPLVAMRDFHALRQAYVARLEQESTDRATTIAAQDLPLLRIAATSGRYVNKPDWWHNFKYREEADRHLDYIESLYEPGFFEFAFDGSQPQTIRIAFGIEDIDWDTISGPDRRIAHLQKIINHVGEAHAGLAIASDDFVVDRSVKAKASTTIMAGYPWFSDWGRDTMIALPGCLITTGRFDEARQTLLTFAAHIRNGLVPNRFDDYGGDPHYNTVDGSLWFVHATLEYVNACGDTEVWNDVLADACRQILEAYAQGTDYEIGIDGDGLVKAGNWQTQLTWMDAARDGVVFTPRHGKAVEINALWYRALAGVGEKLGADGGHYQSLAKRAKRNYARVFWSDEHGYLADYVTDDYTDYALRPNQVIAASLPMSPLPMTKQKRMLAAVWKQLLTPMGMRTLAPGSDNYHGRYEGTMFQRDEAYPQGTVWPWPLGHFAEGWLRAHRFSKQAIGQAATFIAPLIESLGSDGLGSLSEIYDGDAPHHARGCPAQAWSVSEALRVAKLIEEAQERGGKPA